MTRARQLYDAATVVDGTHACAWHKWGLLERYEGNYTRARDLWMQVGYGSTLESLKLFGNVDKKHGKSSARCHECGCKFATQSYLGCDVNKILELRL